MTTSSRSFASDAVLDPVCSWQDGAKFMTESCADVLDGAAARGLFDDLAVDPYIAAGYRYKAMTRVRVRDGVVEEQPHGPLYQPADINTLQQGRSRDYAQLRDVHVLDGLIRRFAELTGIDSEHEILVQAQRTHCVGGALAEPAAEGFHRDGIDFLAIVCVSRENIRGGVTMLAKASPAAPEFERVLQPLQMLLVDDRAWFHYTSPIVPRAGHLPANRDVILLSTSRGTVNRSPEDARAALEFAGSLASIASACDDV